MEQSTTYLNVHTSSTINHPSVIHPFTIHTFSIYFYLMKDYNAYQLLMNQQCFCTLVELLHRWLDGCFLPIVGQLQLWRIFLAVSTWSFTSSMNRYCHSRPFFLNLGTRSCLIFCTLAELHCSDQPLLHSPAGPTCMSSHPGSLFGTFQSLHKLTCKQSVNFFVCSSHTCC